MAGFSYYKIGFKRYGNGPLIYAHGDITNNSGKDYNTAVFRLSIFDKNMLIWTGNIKIRGLRKRQTKSFEVSLEGMDVAVLKAISRHDIYFESGY